MCVVKNFSYDCGHLRVGVIKVRCPNSTDKFLGLPRPTSSCPKLTTFEEPVEGENCPTCEARCELERKQFERKRRQLDRLCKQNERGRAKLTRKWQLLVELENEAMEDERAHMTGTSVVVPATLPAMLVGGEFTDGVAFPSVAGYHKGASAMEARAQPSSAKGKSQQTRHSNPERNLPFGMSLTEGGGYGEPVEELLSLRDKYISAPESADWTAVHKHRDSSLKSVTGSLRVNIGAESKTATLVDGVTAPRPGSRKSGFKAFDPASTEFPKGDNGLSKWLESTTAMPEHRIEDEIFVNEAKAPSDFFVDWTSLQPRPSVVAAGSAQNSVSRRMSRIKSRLSTRSWGSSSESNQSRCSMPQVTNDGPSTKITRNDSLFLPEPTNPEASAERFLRNPKDAVTSYGTYNIDTIGEEPSNPHGDDETDGHASMTAAVCEALATDYFAPYRKSRASDVADDRNCLPSRQQSDRRTRAYKRLTQTTPSVPSDVSLELANAMVEFSSRATASSTPQHTPMRRKPVAATAPSWSRSDDRAELPTRTARVETYTSVDRGEVSVVSIMPRLPPKAVLPPKPKPIEAPCIGQGRPMNVGSQETQKTVSRLDQLFRSDSIVGERQATLRRARASK